MKGSSIVSKANEKGMKKRTKIELSRNKTLIFSRCAGPQALRALRARRPGEIGRTPGEIAKTGAYISRRNIISPRTCSLQKSATESERSLGLTLGCPPPPLRLAGDPAFSTQIDRRAGASPHAIVCSPRHCTATSRAPSRLSTPSAG